MGAGLPLVPVDHLHGHVATLYLAPGSARAAVHLPSRERGAHARCSRVSERTGVRGARLDARRRRRARRSTRAHGCSGSAIRAGAEIDRLAPDGDPEAFAFPVARVPGLDFSFSGSKTALSMRSATSGGRARARGAPISRRPTSARSCRRSSDGCVAAAEQTGDTTVAVVGGVAANSELRAALPDAAVRAASALHRQRRDDRVGRALRARPLVPRLPCARCVRVRRSGVSLRPRGLCVPCRGRRGRSRRHACRGQRAGRACWEAGRCRSSAGGGSSSFARRRSPTAYAGPGGRATELQMRVVDRDRSRRAAPCDRGPLFEGRPGRSGAVLRPRAERLRRLGRPNAPAHARTRPCRCGRLSGPRRVPGRSGPAGARHRGVRPVERPPGRARAAGGRRRGRDRRPARHRHRHPAPVPPGPTPARHRRARCGRRPVGRAQPDRARTAGAARDRSWRAWSPGCAAPQGSAASRPEHRSSRSGSRAGSRMRTAASRSTAAPTSCSPGSRRPSTRTATATPTTARGSRSWASWSRSPPSRTARSLELDAARWRSERSSWPRRETTGRPAPATEASPARREPPACWVSPHRTRAGGAPPSTSCSAPGSASSPRVRPRSAGRPGPGRSCPPPVVALPRRQVVAVTRGNALDRLFDARGYSRVAGVAVLLPSGPTTPEAVRELAAAGARAVLVDGPIPAGSLGVDEPVEVPIVGIAARAAAEVRSAVAAGVPVEFGVGAADFGANPALGAVAPFSSTGLAFDGGVGTGGRGPWSGTGDVGPRSQRGGRGPVRDAQRLERGGRSRRGLGCAPRRGTAGPRRSGPARRARCDRAPRGRRRRPRPRRPGRRVGGRAGRRPAGCGARGPRRQAEQDVRAP